jgi:hypothetical protein
MKISAILITLLFTTTVFCQIPNSGFENWSIVDSIEEPDNWEIYQHPIFFSPDAITKTTDSYSGDFALQATNRSAFFEGYRPGIVTTVFTINGLVNNILGFVKCDSLEGTGKGQIIIHGYLDSIKHEVGYWETSVLIQKYTLIEIPLNPVQYYDSIEIRIVGYAENAPNGAATGFARLKVDQMSIETTSSAKDLSAAPAPEVFPNPCHEVLNIRYPDGNLSQVQLFDIHGRLLLQKSADRQATQLETAEFSNGIYILSLLLQDGRQLSQRIVIAH